MGGGHFKRTGFLVQGQTQVKKICTEEITKSANRIGGTVREQYYEYFLTPKKRFLHQ